MSKPTACKLRLTTETANETYDEGKAKVMFLEMIENADRKYFQKYLDIALPGLKADGPPSFTKFVLEEAGKRGYKI